MRRRLVLLAFVVLAAFAVCALVPASAGSFPIPTLPAPEPTPTLNGRDLTAQHVVSRCLTWLPLVIRWNGEFPELGPDIILSVMAQESGCDSGADDGFSIGLMAVTPQDWTASREDLFDPDLNVYIGMWMLHGALGNEAHNPAHNLRRAMAAYNCGWTSLDAGLCFDFGGFAYADRILEFWHPRVMERLRSFCEASFQSEYRIADQEWLRANGYCAEDPPAATAVSQPTRTPFPTPTALLHESTSRAIVPVSVVPSSPQVQEVNVSFILTAEQIIILSMIAFAIVQVIDIGWVKLLKKPKPQKGTLQIICFVASVPLAYFWGGVQPPIFEGNIFAFVSTLLTASSTVFVVAQVVYDKLMEPILGWIDTKVLRLELFRPVR